MARNPLFTNAEEVLDRALRSSPAQDRFSKEVFDGHKLGGWYSRLLSSLILATHGDSVEFAYAYIGEESSSAKVVVFTPMRVIVATVEDITNNDATTAAQVVPRGAIVNLRVRASEPVDRQGSMAAAWPGRIEVTMDYAGLAEPVTLEGDAKDWGSEGDDSKLWKFYEKLIQELDSKKPLI